ncbi:UDP-3-O-acyl-N-acetylglucosamine deacetylase [Candidatus Magnetomoraceae bacterium gMMP-15]
MDYKQKTIAKEISCSGVGLHSGKKVNLTLKPAPANHGIKFARVDLPNQPSISAIFKKVVDTSLATVIGNDGAIVSTIEHLMASFAGLGIDNVVVETDGYEIPIMDGSALPFTAKIIKAGIKTLDDSKSCFIINSPIYLSENDKSVRLSPSDRFKITCTIEFNHPLLKKQSYSIIISDESFENEICKARTFGFIHEIEYLRQCGLAKGGSLENAVVIDKNSILNEEGLRYHDEFVRHKILDCLGDFSLLGMPIIGHLEINKSGHAFHHAFLEKFFTQKKCWETRKLS